MPYLVNKKYYSKTKLQGSNLIFGSLYHVYNLSHRYLICVSASIVIGVVYWFFIQHTGVYSSGLSAFSQGISRLTEVLIARTNLTLAKNVSNVLFWTLFSVMNIPLIIFAYFKIGKNFTKITVVGILSADLVGLGLGFIPNVEKFVLIFGDPLSASKLLKNKGVQILSWYQSEDLIKIISLFFYATVATLLLSFLYAIVFIVGGCTGGTDFISYYYSIKKQKQLGTIFGIFNTVSLFLGTFIGSYLSASLIMDSAPTLQSGGTNLSKWSFSLLFSPNLVVSGIASMLLGILLNWLFPKSKMSKITIYAADIDWVVNRLITTGYPHTFTIFKGVGAYSKKPIKSAETICQYIEVSSLIRRISALENNAIICVQMLNQMQGTMNILEKID